MKFTLQNNHILVDLPTSEVSNRFLLDTGNPMTLMLDGSSSEVEWGGTIQHIVKSPLIGNIARNNIEELVGCGFEGILGSDFLKRAGKIRIDFKNQEIHFDSDDCNDAQVIEMREMMGVPVFQVSINGYSVMAAYDTGAMYPFVTSDLASEVKLRMTGESFHDYNPMLGRFTPMLGEGALSIGSLCLGQTEIAVDKTYDGILRDLQRLMHLTSPGIEAPKAFIGNSCLADSVIVIDYINGKILIKK